MFVSDPEVNIVVVTVNRPDGMTRIVKAYREQAHELVNSCNLYNCKVG